ncbi:MAG TPA: glutamate 5-kinase [bacterium]|nr:glutamate 5-kinase [bacterium]
MSNDRLLNLPEWKRVVLKVGSALISPENNKCGTQYLLHIANFINQTRQLGKEVIIVSSGAVAAGQTLQDKFPINTPRSIPMKQALAAIGQPGMFSLWDKLFDFPCAQILITLEDFMDRKRYVNVKNTINEVLRMNALPIINENDTVAVHELKVGDNDNMAAHVADLADADLLVLCSDIDGLYTGDPSDDENAELIPEIREINAEIYALAGDSSNPMATGGMQTKIEAAEKAVQRGINTAIINGQDYKNFDHLLNNKLYGSLFYRTRNPRAAKKNWILHTLPSEGHIIVDKGAAAAIRQDNASLLPSGILEIEGKFNKGDAVKIVSQHKGERETVAKGITQYDSAGLEKIKGVHSSQIQSVLGYFNSDTIIQRDDLVLLENITHKEYIR